MDMKPHAGSGHCKQIRIFRLLPSPQETVKGEKEKCMDAGMDDFISKPIIENTLRVAFDKWLPPKKTANDTTAVNGHHAEIRERVAVARELVGDDPAMF
jgi:hypothetical protein